MWKIYNMKKSDPFIIQNDSDKINDKLVKDYQHKYLFEENLFQKDSHQETLSLSIDSKKIRLFFYIIIFIFLVLIIRLINLQLVQGAELRKSAEENRVRIEAVRAPRGIIYDSQGDALVRNTPNFILTFTPADLPEDKNQLNQIINRLSSILNIDSQELSNLFQSKQNSPYEPVTIKEKIDYHQAMLLNIESASMAGVNLRNEYTREYSDNYTFSHILGYIGKISKEELSQYNKTNDKPYLFNDLIGKDGLELFYEKELKGQNGKKQIEVDSQGKEKKVMAESSPQIGENLTLSIDHDLQVKLWQQLDNLTKEKGITGAAAVALNPNTGEVLALVSAPAYDINKMAGGLTSEEYQKLIKDAKNPFFDRAIAGEYPSGSTIKPVIAAAALQEGIITPATTFLSVGGIKIGEWFFPDWKAGGHGLTDVRKAIAESVNTFFYMIGGGDEKFNGLGIDRIKKYAEMFGLNHQLGIDLPGEASGFLPSKQWKESVKKEKWYIGDTYHLSIGQGDLLVTPLQVSSYMAAIANGGTLFKPHLVKKITDAIGNLIKEVAPEIIRNDFIKPEYLKVVREGLRQAVTSGSSRAMADLPFTSAGKTGTAQFGNEGKTHSWFTAFAPYENPEIVITVVVEGGGEGHELALPIAKEALKWWFSKK